MNHPRHRKWPVVNINWSDAASYCAWVGKRLPTEAEWEKAARGTDGRVYPWGDEKPTKFHANYGGKEWADHTALVPVGMSEIGKSPYGIYDMAGNVWEWVNDWYDYDYYKKSLRKNPQGPTTGTSKSCVAVTGCMSRSFCALRSGSMPIHLVVSSAMDFVAQRAHSCGFDRPQIAYSLSLGC